MLTKVRAVSELSGLPELVSNITTNPELDLIQVRNIDGLGPAKASVSTSAIGDKSGGKFLGTSVDPRNIVLTLHPNPDWNEWTYEKLRELTDLYFMPQSQVTLYFETDQKPPVGIVGYVESNEPNMFSNDPETQVSIICPNPDFVAETETVITGLTNDIARDIEYNGTIAAPVYLKVDEHTPATVHNLEVFLRDTFFKFHTYEGSGTAPPSLISATNYVELFSKPAEKYVRNKGVNVLGVTGLTEISLLAYILADSQWPVMKKGLNSFQVTSDSSVQDWTLQFSERYGSL